MSVRGSTLQKHDPQTAARLAAELSGYHIHSKIYFESAASMSVIVVSAGSYYALTGWTGVGKETGAGYLVGDETNGKIVVGAKGVGRYQIIFRGSVMSSSGSKIVHMRLFKNSSSIIGTRQAVYALTSADQYNSIVTEAIEDFASGDELTVRITSSSNNWHYEFREGGLLMVWIAGYSP